jgi:hypothetical protein
MSRLEEMIEAAVAEPPCSPSTLGQLRARTRARTRRVRRRLTSGLLVLSAVAVVIGLVGFSSESGDLGLEISAASVVPLASSIHLLSTAIELGYLPPGYQLASDEIDNPSGALAGYSDNWEQSAMYTKTTSSGVDTLTVNVVEAGTLFGQHAPIPADGNLTSVDGHRGVLNVVPFVAGAQTCLQDELGGLDAAPVTAVTLSWLEQPGIMLQLSAQGLSVATVRQIATNLKFNPSQYDCLQGFHVRSTTGACAPGARYSPAESKTPVIFGQTQYVGGTVNDQPWLLEALGTTFGGSWQFMVHGQSIAGKSQCILPSELPTKSPTLGNPQVVVAETSAGARFAVGHVPAWVTEVTSVTRQGAVGEPVIPRMFWGDRFFVLYLGDAADNCGGGCFGAVALKFDRGSSVGATISFPAPGTSTEPLPFTIAPDQFSGNLEGL